MAEELERIYVVPLRKAYDKPRIKRAKIAVKILRSFISRHMKAGEESVSLSSAVNSAIWESGMKKPPKRVKVIASRDKEGKVSVTLDGEKEAAQKKSEKATKKEDARKEKAESQKKQAKKEDKVTEQPKTEEEKAAEPKKEEKKKAAKKKGKV
ncbi:MAG: 50S ribosomal protein L31e [Candidatus Micrarchaeota archaeon]